MCSKKLAVIITSQNVDNLLGLSADGVIECRNNCEYNCTEENKVQCIPVEVKCYFNWDYPFYNKYYCLPEHYLPQITSEMFPYRADFCILATKKEESVVFKKIDYDDYTWELESEIFTDFYGCNLRKKPTKFHESRKKLKEQFQFFAKANCEIIAELPLLHGIEDNMKPWNENTPYRLSGSVQNQQVNFAQLQEKNDVLIAEAHCVIKDAHICRQKASEILMLSNSNGMKLLTDDTYTHPIAYAMKAYSLNVKTMPQMIQELQNSFHQKIFLFYVNALMVNGQI